MPPVGLFFSTTFMFAGRENHSELLKTAQWFADNYYLQILFWLTHMMAIYATASTVLSTIGVRLMRLLRARILPLCRVCLLYGDSAAVVSACDELAHRGLRPIIVSDGKDDALQSAADAAGGLVWRVERITEDGRWLSRLGIKADKRKLEIICTGGDDGDTSELLLRIIAGLKNKNIAAEQLHLCVICQAEANFDFIPRTVLRSGKHLAAEIQSSAYLAASRLIAEAPPCKTLLFDSLGAAQGDFCAMVIGFGDLGQNVLRLIVRSAQFAGSAFSAVVVDKNLDGCTGSFTSSYGEMIRAYNISFVQTDARSETFVSLLDEMAEKLKYIVVCTGDEVADRKIANLICTYRLCHAARFSLRMSIAVCSREQVTLCGSKTGFSVRDGGESERSRMADKRFPVYSAGELLEGRADALARAVNSIYLKEAAMSRFPDSAAARAEFCRSGWYSMSNISRMSCRAAASAVPALLTAAGVRRGDSAGIKRCLQRLESDKPFLDTLARMEHLRWNAFQYSIGVALMPEAEFVRRIAAATEQAEKTLAALAALKERAGEPEAKSDADGVYAAFRSAFSRVRKDIPSFGVGGVHACLTSWNELPKLWALYAPLEELSRRIEQAYTVFVAPTLQEAEEPPAAEDFQQLDISNVLGILELLSKEDGV